MTLLLLVVLFESFDMESCVVWPDGKTSMNIYVCRVSWLSLSGVALLEDLFSNWHIVCSQNFSHSLLSEFLSLYLCVSVHCFKNLTHFYDFQIFIPDIVFHYK